MSKADRNYHHGNLRTALLDAAEALLTNSGPDAVSTRACAKAASVAPSAVFRHFKDRRALLTALAARGFGQMVACVERKKSAADPAPTHQFRAVGEGYLDYALSHPNMFRLMFDGASVTLDDEELVKAAAGLDGPGEAALGTEAGDTGLLAWAVVHGLATLTLDSQLDAQLPKDPGARQTYLMGLLRRMGPALTPGAV